MSKLSSEQAQLVPIGQLARLTPYTSDFLRQLARSQKIKAVKLGRDWLATRQAVLDYIQNQQEQHERKLDVLRISERSLL